MGYVSPPNSVHWLWDCSVFSVCAEDCVQFWDTETCSVIKSLKLPTKVMTHVIAAKKCSLNKYMAGTKIKRYNRILKHKSCVFTYKLCMYIPLDITYRYPSYNKNVSNNKIIYDWCKVDYILI